MRFLLLALLAAFVAADAPVKNDARRLARWARIDTPWKALQLDDDVEVAEGSRGKADAFPHWVAARGATDDTRKAHAVTPRNIAHFLKKTDGKVITTAPQALELVRTFIAGPVFTTKKDADRVIETARGLEGVALEIREHRPKTYAPVVTGADGAWAVSLVALEVTGRMQLVHVTATVDEAGRLAIKREAIVDGPQLSWQTAYMGEGAEAERERDAERRDRARAHDAMLRCLKSVQLELNAESGWVLARILHKFGDVRRIFGDPTKEWGTTATVWEYHTEEGNKLTFAGGGKDPDRLQMVVHFRRVREGRVSTSVTRHFRQ